MRDNSYSWLNHIACMAWIVFLKQSNGRTYSYCMSRGMSTVYANLNQQVKTKVYNYVVYYIVFGKVRINTFSNYTI